MPPPLLAAHARARERRPRLRTKRPCLGVRVLCDVCVCFRLEWNGKLTGACVPSSPNEEAGMLFYLRRRNPNSALRTSHCEPSHQRPIFFTTVFSYIILRKKHAENTNNNERTFRSTARDLRYFFLHDSAGYGYVTTQDGTSRPESLGLRRLEIERSAHGHCSAPSRKEKNRKKRAKKRGKKRGGGSE